MDETPGGELKTVIAERSAETVWKGEGPNENDDLGRSDETAEGRRPL